MIYTYLATLREGVDAATWSAEGVRVERAYPRFGLLRISSLRPLQAGQLPGVEYLEALRSFRAEEE